MRLRLLLGLVPLLGGCATLRATMEGWGEDASGLSRAQRTLRTALAESDFPVALAWKEDDAVLHALNGGIAAFYAAQYARSSALLDTAALIADARITTSVTRAALTLVTNDLARAYEPRRTERLFVPYYAMLSYTQLGQWEEAAVEARRLSALLAQHARDVDDGERALHGMMHYLAGAVFERAGEPDAAGVAYRNARALVPDFGESTRRGGGTGDVVIIVERGFVAHRVTETLRLDAGGASCEESRRQCARSRDRWPHARTASPPSTAREAVTAVLPSAFRQRDVVAAPATAHQDVPPGRSAQTEGAERGDDDAWHEIRLAFPALRRSPPLPLEPVTLVWDGGLPKVDDGVVGVAIDIDDATAADERRERTTVIARELARSAARVAMTRAVQDKAGEAGGHLAELGAALLARADVRSWHLLPQQLVALRVRLPAGQHVLSLDTGHGTRISGAGPVTVVAGSVAIVPARIWREDAASGRPLCTPPRSCGR